MPKRIINTFFLFIFAMFLLAPTVISIVDDSYDVSFFYSVSEEENNPNEIKHIENYNADGFMQSLGQKQSNKISDFYLNHYSNLSSENLSPPPEQDIL
ncbi:MAG: hypothetical protein GYB39_05700 [Algicola sp.]|nr:hypothetical protein [Algicola sp.]